MTPIKSFTRLVNKILGKESTYSQQDMIVVEQALTELEELKATVKELLDIPITVSTINGTSLLLKTMNKLKQLVGDKDE
jgi:hypothetical protein